MDRLRADNEYAVNIKAEMETAYLHEKAERIHEQMLESNSSPRWGPPPSSVLSK